MPQKIENWTKIENWSKLKNWTKLKHQKNEKLKIEKNEKLKNWNSKAFFYCAGVAECQSAQNARMAACPDCQSARVLPEG